MKKIKLLLVDDHQIVLDGLCSFLEKEPQVEIAGVALSGERALEILQEQTVNVIVMDISMPKGMSGIDTAKAVKSMFPAVKIILLTMHGEGRYILQALRKGIHGYVMKDKSKETLIGAIHAVLNNQTYFPPDLLKNLEETDEEEEAPESAVELTPREKEIACLMAKADLTPEQIAETLHISTLTVRTHIRNAKEKLGMSRSSQLVKYAEKQKWCKALIDRGG